MQFFKKAFIVSFIGILFVGTVGVQIFEHACAINGTDRHLFVEENGSCSIEDSEKPCCKADKQSFSTEKETQRIQEKPCCETANYFYKIHENVQENQAVSVQTIQGKPAIPALVYRIFFHSELTRKRATKIPIPKLPFFFSTKAFLQFIQVYRI